MKEDKTKLILDDMDAIKYQMEENVHHVMDNMVQLEDLEQKSENVKQMSEDLKKKSTTLKNVEWWKKMKLSFLVYGILIFVVCLILIVVALSVHHS